MPKELTDTAIRTAKPREKPSKIADGGGLYVLINPGGGKLWRLKSCSCRNLSSPCRFVRLQRLQAPPPCRNLSGG